MTKDEIEQVKAAIAALEAQRSILGDAVVETALAPLREKLTALTRAAPEVDERKRISILFSDLAGFTATSETMDPEEVHNIMDAYFAHMNPAITRYGGTIEKYIGDAVMALFGAPKALENHEEMAVRAALDMHEALQEFNEEVERKHSIRLAMRIGVNTGLVLFGAMGGRADTDFAAVGDAINLTSRLESAAPVGGVLISARTARPLHAIFDFEPPQQITVKGKREPITVYTVIGEKAKRGRVRGVAGLNAPMVGRDEELATLQSAFERAVSDQCWQVVGLVGEEGIGKSRLQREFVAWLADAHPQTHVLTGRCYAHTQVTPYHLIADLMRGLFNLGSDASPDAALAQLGEALRVLEPEIDDTELGYRLGSLASVLGFPMEEDPLQLLEPEQRRDRTFLSLERLLTTGFASTPLLVVDDLHWADALSLSFVERLAQMAGDGHDSDSAAMLLLISRPAGEPEAPLAKMLAEMAQSPHQLLSLSPLSAQDTDALIAGLFGEAGLPSDLAALILERTEGNPFFVEEILRSLIEDGTLAHDAEADEWQVTRAIADINVPDTVQGVLAARLDQLPAEDKRVVQHAAVSGRTFWQRLLADVVEGLGEAEQAAAAVDASLSRLGQRQLVQRLGESQVVDDWEWLFEQVMAQEVAYDSLPKGVRRRVHQAVARWLEERVGDHSTSLVPMIAYHYELGEVPEKATDYLLQAGDMARGLYALPEAIDYYQRALAFLREGEDHERTARTLMKLGLTYHLAFDFANARQVYDEGFALWQQAGEARTETSLPPAPHPLRADWPYSPLSLDPAMVADVDSTGAVEQLFSGLVELSPELEVMPEVARSWEVLDDGKKYTFHLRDDVRWSDGTAVTAQDFEFAWKRVLDPATASPIAELLYDIKGAREFHQGAVPDSDSVGVQALDDHTLVVELERPTSYFLYLLVYNASFPVPRHAVQAHGESWAEVPNIVTNGPFRLEAWDQNGKLTLSRNAEYHGRFTGNLQRVELHSLPDEPTRIGTYRGDDLDTLSLRNLSEERERIRQRHAGEYISAPMLATTYVGFDVSRPPFDDLRVRRAFALAADKDSWADVGMGGYVFPATGGFVPPGMPGHSAGIGPPYDLDQARELLSDAGFPDGQGFPPIEFVTEHDSGPPCEHLATHWRENLGVEIAWETVEWGAFLERMESQPPHVFLGAWYADYPDPDNFLRVCEAVEWTRWQNEAYGQLLEDGRQVTDQRERMRMYQQADQTLVEEAAIIPFTYGRSHFLVKPWISRFPTSAIKSWFWKDVVIVPHE
jgi:ABC-type oligopeptide transport system substrate-binding subunit/class 3 adenylate cyclase